MKRKIKRNLLLLSLLLVLMIPFIETRSENDSVLKSKEFIENYSMRGQTYRHWYNESSEEYRYSSDQLVHKTGIIDGTDWVTIDEYPYRFILRLTNGSIRTFETPEEISNYIKLINNNTIWAVGYESFAGVMGFYLNFADSDWGHAQYLWWPRLKSGQISSYSQPLYAIYPHLYAKTGVKWFDQILNDRSLYGSNSDPRDNLHFFNYDNEFGIYFSTNNIDILSSNWDIVQGFKYDKTSTMYHMITRMRCNNRDFDDIGLAYEITSSPQSDGTPYQPEYFTLVNETHQVTVNISQAWNAGAYLEDFYSFVSITSQNNESFRFTFTDMQLAGFTQKYLELHDQMMPNGSTRKTLRAGMYGYGSYSQGTWIEIDPDFSADQTVDSRDFYTRRLNLDYDGYSGHAYFVAGIHDLSSDKTYRAGITWDSGITEEIESTSDGNLTLWAYGTDAEIDEYVAFGLYDKGDADEYWDESEAVANPKGFYDEKDSLYYADTDFETYYGKVPGWVSTLDAVTGLLIDGWVTHHNNHPETRQYIPIMLYEGDGQDDGVGQNEASGFDESTNADHKPILSFTYTIAEPPEPPEGDPGEGTPLDYYWFSEYQIEDAYDFYIFESSGSYYCTDDSNTMSIGMEAVVYYNASISWDTEITLNIYSITDAVLKLYLNFEAMEGDENLTFGLYDKGDTDGIWDETEADADPQGCWEQSLYWSDDSFWNVGSPSVPSYITFDANELMEEWRLHHNEDPLYRQFIPIAIRNGSTLDGYDEIVFSESTWSTPSQRPHLSFFYTVLAEEEEADVVVEEEHDPIIQEPPVWFATEFAWFIWTLIWSCAGIIVAGAILYYFFKQLFSIFS